MEGIPDEAAESLRRLMEGNAAHLRGETASAHTFSERAYLVENGQHPYACVVGCADSRVPPEILFCARAGEIFAIRNAGNVADRSVIDSVGYAVHHLHVPLVVVMGHTHCGAVDSALKGEKAYTFDAVRSHISGTDPRRCEADNARGTVRDLLRDQSISEAVSSGETVIVAALCDTETGRVDLLQHLLTRV